MSNKERCTYLSNAEFKALPRHANGKLNTSLNDLYPWLEVEHIRQLHADDLMAWNEIDNRAFDFIGGAELNY